MIVSGTFATTPLAAPSLSYFWYGCLGNAGANVTPFLTFGGLSYGFVFCPPSLGTGTIVTTSDQDWVRTGTSPALMQNILHHLINRTACSPLPLSDLTLTAVHLGDNAVGLSWNGIPDQPTLRYHVERSIDQGTSWQEIHMVSGNDASFAYTDEPNMPGATLQYRIRLTGPDGLEYMSEIKRITMDAAAGVFNVFPSPVARGNAMGIRFFTDLPPGSQVAITDIEGRVVILQTVETGLRFLELPVNDIAPGIYLVTVTGDGIRAEQRISIQ